ncbi:MAG: hypothetical protein U0441_32695 [Polyangiaceae bacterium]
MRSFSKVPVSLVALAPLLAGSSAIAAEPPASPPSASVSSTPVVTPAALPAPAPADPWYRFRPQIELGFLGVLSNRVQFGKQGTYFNYQSDGGQDNLYFFARLSVEVEIARRHNLTFLYQPLDLNTRVQLPIDLVVDEAKYPKGTAMAFKYGFPFYRFSYMYDFFGDDDRELSIGLSAQIRNTTIEFATADGATLKSYRDIGFVPLLKSRGRYTFKNGVFVGHEIDGIYAPIRGVNGSDNEVTGALVDASVRVGLKLPSKSEAFLNVRYLAGGATGQSDPETFSDGKTKNWLQFLTVSLGGTISSF